MNHTLNECRLPKLSTMQAPNHGSYGMIQSDIEVIAGRQAQIDNNRGPDGKWHPDRGIEVLYRFANIDPFPRSIYFG